jgi:hypothetical protein
MTVVLLSLLQNFHESLDGIYCDLKLMYPKTFSLEHKIKFNEHVWINIFSTDVINFKVEIICQ